MAGALATLVTDGFALSLALSLLLAGAGLLADRRERRSPRTAAGQSSRPPAD